MSHSSFPTPDLGVGIGLRSIHYGHILDRRPDVPWFEVISENFMGLREPLTSSAHGTASLENGERCRGGAGGPPQGDEPRPHGGRPFEVLEKVRKDYPIMLHGVSLNIGSTDPLNSDYLKRLKELAARTDPVFVSDHLCWTGVGGENLHDLLPLPYTEEALAHVTDRVKQVQDLLGRRILLENVSSYVTYKHSEMPEWEFLTELSRRSDCGLLLDVNNVFVSATNHGFDPVDFIAGIPQDRVAQMHLGGYTDDGGFFIDTHDHPVSHPVWDLYAAAVRRFGAVPTLIEWDDKIPAFEVLQEEAAKASKIRETVLESENIAIAR
jgi:uncharacterized protein (UPF0276 family)